MQSSFLNDLLGEPWQEGCDVEPHPELQRLIVSSHEWQEIQYSGSPMIYRIVVNPTLVKIATNSLQLRPMS